MVRVVYIERGWGIRIENGRMTGFETSSNFYGHCGVKEFLGVYYGSWLNYIGSSFYNYLSTDFDLADSSKLGLWC